MARLAALLLATLGAGCATGDPTFASRFIAHGRPAIDVGGIEPAKLDGKAANRPFPAAESVRTVTARPSGNLSTLEGTSPALQQALWALTGAPAPQQYLDVAAAYLEAGVPDAAFDYLTEGVRRSPSDAPLHDALARAWRDWGFPDRALTAAHRAVYYGPLAPESRNTLGTVLWALGQRTEARQAFEAAVALEPRAWYAWTNLCHAALAEGRTKDATRLCRHAAALRRSRRTAS